MEYTRTPFAVRGRSIVARLNPVSRDGRVGHPRAGLGVRVRTIVAQHRPTAESLRERAQRVRYSTSDLNGRLRNRGFLLRVGCAGAAVVLLLVAVASSSTQRNSGTAAMFGDPGSAPTATAPQTPSLPTTAASTPAAKLPATPAIKSTTVGASAAATHLASVVPHTTPAVSPRPPATTPAAPVAHPGPVVTSAHTATHAVPAPVASHPSATPALSHPAPPPPPPEGCAMSGVHCSGSGLIYGDSTGGLAGAPSVTNAGYQGIGPGSSFAQITQRFGAPLSRAQLSAFVGVGSLQSLVQNQPGGESCAYYLDSSEPGRQAFQLCFNAGYSLADKSVLTTSAATPTASKSSSS